MKKLRGYLIAIGLVVLSNTLYAQSHLVPDSVIDKVVLELADKDFLEKKTKYQDTVITMYQHRDSLHREIEKDWTKKEESYETTIKAQEDEKKTCEAEKKDIKKAGIKTAVKTFLAGMGTAGTIILLIVLL